FLAYLGYGYLDTWHGTATLGLLVCFITGVVRTFFTLPKPVHIHTLFIPSYTGTWTSKFGIGRACLLLTAVGMMVGGLTILLVGMTRVFVPQDLQFLGLTTTDLHAINPRLLPLIAHDRACFGGVILTC